MTITTKNQKKEAIIFAYQNGMGMGRIASHVGCSQQSISKMLREWGIEVRAVGTNRRIEDNLAAEIADRLSDLEPEPVTTRGATAVPICQICVKEYLWQYSQKQWYCTKCRGVKRA